MTRFERLKLIILGADPALLALRMSCRLVVAMAVVCATMAVIGKWHPMPRPAYVLALIATMQGSLQINDATASARRVTRVYAALGAFAAVATISALHDSLRYINIALVLIVFAATYVARFGVRWKAVGTFTFMCAVVAAYLNEDERDLWSVAAALIVSGVAVDLIRRVVMPDDPAQDFRRLVAAAASASRHLRGLVGATRQGEALSDAAARRREKDQHLAGKALSTAIRACEAALPLEAPGEDHGETTIALRLLDLQLAAEMLIEQADPASGGTGTQERGTVEHAVQDVQAAEMELNAAVAALPANVPSASAQAPPPHPVTPFPKRGEWLQDQALRQSLQVTLACAIAAILGEAISSQRWFWAVISAFIIFNNTQSGAAVAVRGLDRTWGTAIGIVIGIVLATLTHDHLVWLGVALAVSVFLTFFIARVSYVAMSLFLTISLSLIYGLIGIFTPALLVLRLEETAIGVASGASVALLLFPISIHQQAAKAMNGLLKATAYLLQTIADARQPGSDRLMAGKAAAVDRALGTVLTTIGPLRSTWSFGSMVRAGRDMLREAYVMAYAAHRLERSFRDKPPEEAQIAQLLALSERLRSAAGDQAGSHQAAGGQAPAPTATGQSAPGASQPDDDAGALLGILSRMLDGIEAERQRA